MVEGAQSCCRGAGECQRDQLRAQANVDSCMMRRAVVEEIDVLDLCKCAFLSCCFVTRINASNEIYCVERSKIVWTGHDGML